ncbi:TRAP transporter substrate-binding protein [Roseovarius sp. EGI FJ00037]|uniref:TRAP transporter substrate-binding protein n=1 Tax=Roseovarius salincola TaxID=2978479 RepID=UPI0022A8534F|nr:TRAP transporter substrate-binding protein [Roseovarius sp. EGI FJ00037]MCZ0813317.1 TRAP transporter substrate-binding protein [Roseovarius sp. EGI FJ00037]
MLYKHEWMKGFAASLFSGLWLFTASPAVAEDTYQMRIQAAVPSGAMSFEMLERFGDRVESMSNGRLSVRVLAAGAVVPSSRILESVDSGLLEAGFAWPQFWAGKHPATALFSNSPVWPRSGLDELSHLAWMYEGGGEEIYEELLQEVIGVDVVSFFVTPSGWQPLGWFNEPIENMEQFRQIKYRSPPGLVGQIFQEAGVTTVFLPGPEVLPAAERGVIDAAEWINPVEDLPFGFHQVFDNYYLASVHQFIDIGEIIVNQQFWESLPADLQEMVRTAARATIIDTFVADIARNADAIRTLKTEHGINVRPTPPDIHAELMAAAGRVLEKNSGDNPFFKRVVESQEAFAGKTKESWGEILKIYGDLSED